MKLMDKKQVQNQFDDSDKRLTSPRAARVSESVLKSLPKAEREKTRLPSVSAPLTTSRTACSISSGRNAAVEREMMTS